MPEEFVWTERQRKAYLDALQASAEAKARQMLEPSPYERMAIDALNDSQAQERPRAVLLGGQPELDWSEMERGAIGGFREQGGAVVVTPARIHEAHPEFSRLLREYQCKAFERIRPDVNVWSRRLIDTASANKRNLVVVGALDDPAKATALAKQLKERGYEVEVRAKAINYDVAYARSRFLFEKSVSETGVGNLVSRTENDRSITGLGQSVAALERDKLVDAVNLYGSEGLLYQNHLEEGQWKQTPEAGKVFGGETGRALDRQEHIEHIFTLDECRKFANLREGARDGVRYELWSQHSLFTSFDNVPDAARAFHKTPTEFCPSIWMASEQERTNIAFIEATPKGEYRMEVHDLEFGRALEAAQTGKWDDYVLLGDRAVLADQFERARDNLVRYDKGEIVASREALPHMGNVYEGKIVLADGKRVLQQTDGGIVQHNDNHISGKKLEPGQHVTIDYRFDKIGFVSTKADLMIGRQEKEHQRQYQPSFGR